MNAAKNISRESKQYNYSIYAFQLIAFIDMLTVTIVMPIFPQLIVSPELTIDNVFTNSPAITYSILMAITFFCMFLSGPITGILSDKKGRKLILLLCIIGNTISHLFVILAITNDLIYCLFLSRIIAGISSGSYSIVQASVVDISSELDKQKNMGKIIICGAIGAMCGPLIGGILSSKMISGLFSTTTPFVVAVVLCSISFIFTCLYCKTPSNKGSLSMQFMAKELMTIIPFLQYNNTLRLHFTLFAMSILFNFVLSAFPYHLVESYDYTSLGLGLVLGFATLFYVISIGIQPWLLAFKKLSPKNLVKFVSFIFMVGATLPLWGSSKSVILSVLFIASASAITYSTLIVLVSNSLDKGSQGKLMGIILMYSSLGATIGGLLCSFLQFFNYSYLLASFIFLIVLSAKSMMKWMNSNLSLQKHD